MADDSGASFDTALAHLHKRIRANPHDVEALKRRAQINVRRGAFQKAIDDCDCLLRVTPLAGGYYYRGWALREIGQNKRALEDLTEAIRLWPSFAGAHFQRAWVHHRLGRLHDALDDLDRAINLAPNKIAGYTGRAYIHFAMGNFEAAASDYTKRLEMSALDRSAVLALRARARLRSGQLNEALADAGNSMEADPTNEFARELRAEILLALRGK